MTEIGSAEARHELEVAAFDPRLFSKLSLPAIEYPAHYEVRKVSDNGGIRWACQWVNVTVVLGGQYIGLEEIDDGIWHVLFGPHLLGYLIDELGKIEDRAGFLARKNQKQQRVSPMSADYNVTYVSERSATSDSYPLHYGAGSRQPGGSA